MAGLWSRGARVACALLVMAAGMAGAGSSMAQAPQQATAPAAGPVAQAVRTTVRVVVDGLLDEEGWREAAPLTGFVQRLPAEGSPATQDTQVRILFDDEHLYIGAELMDADPGSIIAREMKEDGDLDHDDMFSILLDTFHDKRNGFYFETNPNGARADALVYDEGRTLSFDWDGVWEVSSRVTGHGWVVEMAIPFKTLHFDPRDTSAWGLQVSRLIRRNAEDVFWAPIPRAEDRWRVSRSGELRGLEGIRQGKSLALKPYALGAVRRLPTFGDKSADGSADVGLDARYDLTPNLAAVLTVNTDFAETEVDDQQVNITRFELFFPEKREFFLESTGYYDFGFNRRGGGAPPGIIPFFSRRIGLASGIDAPLPIQAGAKIAGRSGRYNLGFLTVNTAHDVDTPQTNYSVLRVSRDILTRSNWGFIGVSKEPAGDAEGTNRTYGADVNFSVLGNFKFGGALMQTRTPGIDGGRGEGNAYATWTNDTWRMELYHHDIGKAFDPQVGFVERVGIEQTEAALGWYWRSDTAKVRAVEPHMRIVYTADQDHELATRRQHWGTIVEFRNGSEVEFAFNPLFDEIVDRPFVLRDEDGDPNTRADNVEIRPGAYHPTQWLFLYDGDASRVLSGSLFAEWGDFFDGTYRSYDVSGTARVSKHVRSSLGVNRTEINLPSRPDDDPDPLIDTSIGPTQFHTTLIQGRLGVAFTTRIFFDALLQYNTSEEDFSSNLRFNYKYRPGSDIYVVYNERRDIEGVPADTVDRSFTVKWTWLVSL